MASSRRAALLALGLAMCSWSASSVAAAAPPQPPPGDTGRVKAQSLLDEGVELVQYLIAYPAFAVPYVDTVIIPQLINYTESMHTNYSDFVFQIVANVRGSVFNGTACVLSPAALEYARNITQLAAFFRDVNVTSTGNAMEIMPPSLYYEEAAPWHLDRIDSRANVPTGDFNYSMTGEGVDIYVIDSGINTAHVEFAGGRIQDGINVHPSFAPNDVEDCYGHGSHVAGLAAGQKFGVAKGATIIPVRVFDCYGQTTVSAVLDAMNYVSERMANTSATSGRRSVINLSLTTNGWTPMNTGAESLVAQGAVVVVAAANDMRDACDYSPASANGVITVAASRDDDLFAGYSNYGSCVSIIAPGSDVMSAYIGGPSNTAIMSGTSMASPLVAGVAATTFQMFPTANASFIKRTLLCASTPNAIDGFPGYAPTINRLLYSPPSGLPPNLACLAVESSATVAVPIGLFGAAFALLSVLFLELNRLQ